MSKRIGHQTEKLEARALLAAPVFSQEEYNVTINQGYYDGWHVFGNVNAADPDNTFVGYYGGTNGFYIDGMSGDLRFNGNEVTPGNYTFTATASDEDSETDTATININISNSAPVFAQAEYTFEVVAGYHGSYEHLGNVSASDPDGGFVGYSGGTDGFQLDGMEGFLYFVNGTASVGTYTFTAHANDGFGGSDTATVTVNVIPRPNNAPVFSQSSYVFTVTANASDGYYSNGETLGTLSAVDSDGDPFGITGGVSGFYIDAMSGELRYNSYSTAAINTYTFTAYANDEFGGFDTAEVTIHVVPRPNTDPEFSQSVYDFTVVANTPWGWDSYGQMLGVVNITDAEGDYIGTYTDNNLFQMNWGEIYLAWGNNTLAIGDYNFNIYATDSFGGLSTAVVNLHVVPRPNTDPEFSQSVYDFTVVANTPWGWDSYGQMLGVVNITDAEGDYIGTYTDNNLFQMNWGEIYLAWGNNTLAIGDYNFNIYATDSFGGLSTAVVNLHVVPRPNTPPVFTQEVYDYTIIQGYYDGWSSLGNVLAIDAEGDFVGYYGTSYDVNNPTSGFYIDSMSGELRYSSYHITPGSYTFTVTASDEYGGSDSATINIIVPNSPPVFTQEIYYFSIEPGEYAYDHVFGTVSAIDSDGGFVGYSGEFRDTSNNLIFYVDPMSGEIRLNSNGSTGNINVASGSYFMTISASDEFGGSDVAEVTIIVNAPNQAPEFISDINPATELEYDGDEYHFDYDPADEGIVGYVTVEDEGDTTLTLEGEHSSLFTINEYGSIMAAGALAIGNYTFTVKTTDSAGLQDTATVFVTANHAPVFSQEVYNFEVTLQELITGGIGYAVANNIIAIDADGETVTYSLMGISSSSFVLLDNNSSNIMYTGLLPNEGTHSFYIQAEDTHGASAYAQVNIHVIDELNDPRTENAPPEIVLDDQDSIYEPDTDGYVTITGHLEDYTNYRTTYGSTYELKLLDANEDVYEAADISLNQGDLSFTVRINTIGFPNGLINFKLLAEEEVLGLVGDLTNAPINIQVLPNQQKFIYREPFVWLKDDNYTEAEMVETEKKFLRRLNEMRKLGGLAGYLAFESLKRLTSDGGKNGSLRIHFNRNLTPGSTITTADTIYFSPKDIANDFADFFKQGSSLGVMNNDFHRFVVVYGHELGHAMASLKDPGEPTEELPWVTKYGGILVLENMIRSQLKEPFREYYATQGDNYFSTNNTYLFNGENTNINKYISRMRLGDTDIKYNELFMFMKHINQALKEDRVKKPNDTPVQTAARHADNEHRRQSINIFINFYNNFLAEIHNDNTKDRAYKINTSNDPMTGSPFDGIDDKLTIKMVQLLNRHELLVFVLY